MKFEIIEHPADVGFLAYGTNLTELFENAALALCSLACAPETVEERISRQVQATGGDIESLLYAWLAAIVALADAEQLVLRRIDVGELRQPKAPATGEVRGAAHGEHFERTRHRAGTYIKAVTMHQFAIERIPQGFRARVFVDL